MNLPLVWDGTAFAQPLHPTSLSVYQSIMPLSTANMTLPEYEDIALQELVKITTPDGVAEVYRVSNLTTDPRTKETDVYLEHCACFLGDYIIPESTTASGSISSVLSTIMGYQKASEEPEEGKYDARWTIGSVDPGVASFTIYAELGSMTVLDAINDMMTQIPAYQCVFNGDPDGWTLSIVARPTQPICEARLSRNIESCEITKSTQGLCTRVVSSGLTGGYMDSANILEMGVHEENMMLNDNLNQSQRDAIAAAYLAVHSIPAVSVSIQGVELCKLTGLTLDRFSVGVVCRLSVPGISTMINEVIIDKRYRDALNEPENVVFTMANATADLTIAVAASAARGGGGGVGSIQKKEQKEEHKRFETKYEKTDQYFRWLATDSEWQQIGNNWEQNITAYSQIVQTADNIQHVVTQTGSVTNEFDPKVSYHIGDRVLHGGVAYKFTKDHLGTPENPIGWIGTGENGDVIPVENLYSQIDQTSDSVSSVIGQTGVVTEVFSPDKLYAQGRKVLYNGVPYEFTAIHQPGPWIGTDAKIVPTMASQIAQNATDISAKVSRGDLSSYLLIDQFGTKLGTTLNTADQTLKAEIATAINSQTGDSIVNISANRVNIDADKSVKISDVLFITDGGSFWVKRNATFGSTAGSLVTINGGTVNAPTLQVNSGGILKFAGSSQSESALQISRATMAGLITDIQVAAPTEGSTSYTVQYKKIGTGDTWQTAQVPIPGGGGGGSGSSGITDAIVTNGVLTLTKADGTSVTFKKATSLSGVWSSGTYTVTAKQINYNTITQEDEEVTVGTDSTEIYGVDVHGTITRQSTPKFLNVPVRVLYTDSQEQSGFSPTGFTDTIGVDASLIFEDGETAGKGAVNLKTFNNQKKATWIDDDDPLHPATYYISTDGKGTGNEDEAWIDPSDAIDYGKTLVSVTRTWNEYAETPTSPTTLDPGKTYNLVVKKDETDVYNEFYTVPSAPVAPDPKVSRGNWTNGSLKFTAGTTGENELTVKIKGGAQTADLIKSGSTVTGIKFDVLEDDGTVSGKDTGTDITASVTSTPATLALGNYDDTNNKFTVSKSTGGWISVGLSDSINVDVTPLDIPVSGGTVKPTEMVWLPNSQKYKVTASGSITVGGHEFTMTGEETFTANNAINAGIEKAGTLLSVTQTDKAGYESYPNITPTDILSAQYYLVKIGSKVYKRFQAPSGGSGSSSRTATYLEQITLAVPENPTRENLVISASSIAHYANPTSVGTEPTSVTIDTWAIYQAGIAAGSGGTVTINRSTWTNGTCQFTLSNGTGSPQSVQIAYPLSKPGYQYVNDVLTIDTRDYSTNTSINNPLKLRLVQKGISSRNYACIYRDGDTMTNANILAKIDIGSSSGDTEQYYVTSIDSIKLTASDISTVTKYPVLHYNDPSNTTDNTIPLQIDASEVYNKGLTDASRFRYEDLRIITQPLTVNTNYTFKPSDYYDYMAGIKFTVNVPPVYRTAESLANTIVLPASHKGTAAITGNTVEYDMGSDTGNFSVVIDASNVYEQGRSDGADLEIQQDRSVTYTTNGERTVYPTGTYGALSKVKVNVNVPQKKIQDDRAVIISSNDTYTIKPTGSNDAMSVVELTVNVPGAVNPTITYTKYSGTKTGQDVLGAVTVSGNSYLAIKATSGNKSTTKYINLSKG